MTTFSGPHADVLSDLERLYGPKKPSYVTPPVRKPVSFTKSFASFGRVACEQKKLQSQAEAEQQNGFLDRLSAGVPTEEDLVKAYEILDGAVGQIPHDELCAMDLKLRELEMRTHRPGEPLAKSLTGNFNLRRARQQLDGLFGKIPGNQYREMDFTLRQLETAAHG